MASFTFLSFSVAESTVSHLEMMKIALQVGAAISCYRERSRGWLREAEREAEREVERSARTHTHILMFLLCYAHHVIVICPRPGLHVFMRACAWPSPGV